LVKDEIKCEGLTTLKRDEPEVFINHIRSEMIKIAKMTGNDDVMDGDVIVLIADSLLDIYGNFLTLPDISYAVQKGISGQFGKVYGKINPMMILEWIKMYEEDKIRRIEELRIKEAEQFKGGGPRSDGTQSFKDSIREAQNQYSKDNKNG